MNFERAHIGYFIAFLVIGAILGSALGTMVARYVPALSFLKENLTGPIGFNIEILTFSLRLNLAAILGLVVGFFLFRRA